MKKSNLRENDVFCKENFNEKVFFAQKQHESFARRTSVKNSTWREKIVFYKENSKEKVNLGRK